MTTARLSRGDLTARLAQTPEEVREAQALRHRAFFVSDAEGVDADAFDGEAAHILIERAGALLATCRYVVQAGAAEAARGYTGQFYDLSGLSGLAGPCVELGRFCIAPGATDPDVIRLAWGFLTDVVDGAGARLLYGCTSFPGADPARHTPALQLLRARHLGPEDLRPKVTAHETLPLPHGRPDLKTAQAGLPPLLRTYLMMGGWVSDHAVIDRDMDTLHVFTGVEIDKIPPGRARALRAL